jgi:hypothetical protein
MLRYTVELAFVSILMKRQARLTLDAPPFPTDEGSSPMARSLGRLRAADSGVPALRVGSVTARRQKGVI